MFQVRLVGNHLNDFQVKLTMGHLCNIFQVGKVKAEQLKRADGSVEVWSRWQCGSVEPMAAAISAGSCSRAPQCGVHTDVQCSSAIDCEQNSAKMSELPYYLL